MSFTILPNYSLGFGVVLHVVYNDGTTEEIPCHNRATAEYIQRTMKTS